MSTILPITSYNNTSAITGNKYKGDSYYGRGDGLHTVAYFFENFVGTIRIQASLAVDPSSTDWFDVTETLHGDGNTALTGSVFKNFTGNFVWVRVSVQDFSAGSISKVSYNH